MSEKKNRAADKAREYSFKACRRVRRDDGLVMYGMKRYTFRDFVDAVSARYGKLMCYTVYGGEDEVSFSYRYLAFKVHAISSYLLRLGVRKGDRICIYGESSPMWMMFYLGLTGIGAIAVPILPGFSGKETIVAMEDSGCIGICAQTRQFQSVADHCLDKGMLVFRLEDLMHIPSDVLSGMDKADFASAPGIDITHAKFSLRELASIPLEEDDIASIIYTSGTTGSSKGVVLTHRNILRNADRSSYEYIHVKPGMRVLSILPISHIYEFTIGQLLSMNCGLEIHFLGKPPAVSVLLPALKKIRPHVIQTVPLLIEKVYKSAVAPVIKGEGKLAKAYANPLVRGFVARLIGSRLKTTFGGKLKFFGIGGSALDKEVEDFLYRARFPYALGYGLTETSPLLAGCGPRRKDHVRTSVGKVHPDVDMVLLDKDGEGVGEIAVKGPNVTPGYYNNPELNAEAFTKDGYFRTGDLGAIVRGRLYIKGRCKTMILGPAGENIYPESIESVINNMQFVQESLVVPEGTGLLALIRIDLEAYAKSLKIDLDQAREEAKKYVLSLRGQVNKELSAQNRIDAVELQEEDFERTATQKIKRFLYPKKNKEDGQ